MDLISKIHGEVDGKDWDQLTLARYLYLRSCEEFCYDNRFFYADNDFCREIRNRVIDLKNYSDNRIVCESWAGQVYIPLLEEFGIGCKFEGLGRGHQYVSVDLNGKELVADACICSDTARVKMKNSTRGFYSNERFLLSSDKLKEIDINIGYINSEYFIDKLRRNITEASEEDTYCYGNGYTQNDNKLISSFYNIKSYLDDLKNIKSFSDSEYVIVYLMDKILPSFLANKVDITLLKDDSVDSWNFKKIYTLRLSKEPIYFLLEDNNYSDGKKCNFYEVTEHDVKQLKKLY